GGSRDTVATNLLEHLRHQIRPRTRLAEERLATELHRHAFGAGRDERGAGANEHPTRLRRRGGGNVGHGDLTGSVRLEYLLHEQPSPASSRRRRTYSEG